MRPRKRNPWRRVIHAHDCLFAMDDDDYSIAICPVCKTDYAECPCPGPTMDDEYEYKEKNGVLYARRRK